MNKEGSMLSVSTRIPPEHFQGMTEMGQALVSISVPNVHCLFESFPLLLIILIF